GDPQRDVRIATLIEKAAQLERKRWLFSQWFLIGCRNYQLNVRMVQSLQCGGVTRHPGCARLAHSRITKRQRRITHGADRPAESAQTGGSIGPDLVNAFTIRAADSRQRIRHLLYAG